MEVTDKGRLIEWWRSNRNGLYTLWFFWWLLLGPAALGAVGQRDAAELIASWRWAVVPVSAGLLYWIHKQDGATALALGWLLFTAFLMLEYGPGPRDPDCVPSEDYSCASGNAITASLMAVAALTLAFYRPAEDELRRKIRNVRTFLYRAKVDAAEADFIEETGRGHTLEELQAMQTTPPTSDRGERRGG